MTQRYHLGYFLSEAIRGLDKFVFYVTLFGVTLIGVMRSVLWKILFTMEPQ